MLDGVLWAEAWVVGESELESVLNHLTLDQSWLQGRVPSNTSVEVGQPQYHSLATLVNKDLKTYTHPRETYFETLCGGNNLLGVSKLFQKQFMQLLFTCQRLQRGSDDTEYSSMH